MRIQKAADLFCGAGGTSIGAQQSGAAEIVFAVNHWDVAVKTHSANFPNAQHINSRLDMVSPSSCPKIDLLFASPECTYFSHARGGKPTSDQQRSGAWDLMRWIEFHRPSNVVVENVREFREWGPVGKNGRPLSKFRCKFFDAWVMAIEAAGYKVDWRMLNAADYGAATSRDRLFVIARKGNRSPIFPEPSHCQTPGGEFPGLSLPRWRPAMEIIDWSITCPSIFSRKRPLADTTLARIEAGLKRFCGPTVVRWDQTGGGGGYRDVDGPLETLVTKANMGVAVPYQYQLIGRGAGRSRSVADPMPTMIASRENHGVMVPFQTVLRNHKSADSIDGPVGVVCAGGNHHGISVPYVVPNRGERDGQTPRTHALYESMPTIATKNGHGLAVPFLFDVNHSGPDARSASLDYPVATITAHNGKAVAVPLVMSSLGGGVARSAGSPTPTLTASGGAHLMMPFLTHYYGTHNMSPTSDPLDTITTKGRHGIAIPVCEVPFPTVDNPSPAMRSLLKTMRELGVRDIGFRMLSNPELAAAQGFDPDYVFCGVKHEVTRQIGNSVSPPVANAITTAIAAA